MDINGVPTALSKEESVLLRELQLVELSMLKFIDTLCQEEGIAYSLYGGTLLGAIRHGGFIPWDDDLDICMTREDFSRLVNAWERRQPEGYFLQTKDSDPTYVRSFAKIRKEDSLFLQRNDNPNVLHNGVFIDIFVLDRIPNGKLDSVIFKLESMLYVLYTREFVPPKAGPITKLITEGVLLLTPKSIRPAIRKYLLSRIIRWGQDDNLQRICIETPEMLSKPLPSDLCSRYLDIRFEDNYYQVFWKWKEYLINRYGDYTKLPPLDERTWFHHPVSVRLGTPE